jgi:ankyrin repeat protein
VTLFAALAFHVLRSGTEHATSERQDAGASEELMTPDEIDGLLADLPRPMDPPDLTGDLNAPTAKGKTRLFEAIEGGNLPAVEALLAAGADPNRPDGEGTLPLAEAATSPWREGSDMVRALLGAGARVEGEIAADLVTQAAFRGKREIVVQLVDSGVPLDARDADGETALISAAKWGRAELVRELLARGADPALQDIWGMGALGWAASRVDAPEVIAALIAGGAPVEALDDDGWTPLMTAAARGRVGVVRALLEAGADPRRRHPEHGSARDCAVRAKCERLDEIATLLEAAEERLGDAPIPAPAPDQRPVLSERQRFRKLSKQFLEAALGDHEEARRLLAATPALLETHELDFGETPLLWAAVERRVDTVRFLAALGADVDARDRSGDTALHSAACGGDLEMLEVLLALGASPNVVSTIHDSALECAVRSGSIPTVERLLDAGASPSGLDLKESLPEDEGPCDAMTEFLRGRRLLK